MQCRELFIIMIKFLHILRCLLLIGLAAAPLSSCSSLKASAVASSAFLEHRGELKPDTKHSPFLGNWTSPAAAEVFKQRRSIYIAPLNLSYLRPMKRDLAKSENTEQQRLAEARELVRYAGTKFADAFDHSPASRYKLVAKPGKDSLTLELALVELNPNPVSGGLLRTAINAVAIPGVDSVLAKGLKANIAIEGKVLDSRTKKSIFEFADNQENKSALIFSVTDFSSYAQARQSIDEWAKETEELLRTPPDKKVSGSAAFVILPWN